MLENIKPINSVDLLCGRFKAELAKNGSLVIGLDGLDGIGKTTLARELAQRLNAKLISLDQYEEKGHRRYVENLRCSDIIVDISSITVIEGVCLRAVEERCQIFIDLHIYVRRIDKYGIWDDEELCLSVAAPDVLKQRERDLQETVNRIIHDDDANLERGAELGLLGELIDYHHTYHPVERADIVFDLVQSGSSTG